VPKTTHPDIERAIATPVTSSAPGTQLDVVGDLPFIIVCYRQAQEESSDPDRPIGRCRPPEYIFGRRATFGR
jgi:hypothetical protein